ncbi:hypothetical protein [Sorangium sp. So ce861]|uniref:hypothetical protein n=1 Tax=Sorangium sp. So ce861 TaxID=3133323 RepID=UPI003F5DC2FF
MKLSLSASAIKNWFQYRCERKLVYETIDQRLRKTIPILEQTLPAPWADFGREYEGEVVSAYAKVSGVRLLAPPSGESDLGERMSLEFLQGSTGTTAAYQLVLTGTSALRRDLGLEGMDIEFRRGIVDLLLAQQVGGRRVLRLVDIKSTHAALPFHKMQLAWYGWMLRGVLEQNAVDASVDVIGEIWHRSAGVPAEPWKVSAFPLRSYEAVIQDFARRELREAVARTVHPERDDTRFHIYFKCEQCSYLLHCGMAIADALPPRQLDVSAVPGMSQQSKSTLRRMQITTVGALIDGRGQVLQPTVADWRLSTHGREIVERAAAIVAGAPHHVPGRVTLRMPPKTHVQIHLVADRDPMAARLATVGASVIEEGTEIARVIRLVARAEDEAGALLKALGVVRDALRRAHEANVRGAANVAHVFVFEPAESADLAEALGRNLHDPRIVSELIELVRIFPPDFVVPEPSYRGYHHLPASALRSVVEELFALPARVSYDLARVSAALATSRPAPKDPYVPAREFARPFSSRLSLARCREIAEGGVDQKPIVDDVGARLSAMAGLVAWLEATDAALAPPDRFLRLKKAPFKLHATVDPLNAPSLEILRAQALLEKHTGLVATLHELAQPVERRRSRLSSIGPMRLVKQDMGKGGGVWFLFKKPAEAIDADIAPGDFMLLLSDGHPDRVLDPSIWNQLSVKLHPPKDDPSLLFLTMGRKVFESPVFQECLARLGNDGWILDRGYFDVNSERLATFLRHVAQDREAP